MEDHDYRGVCAMNPFHLEVIVEVEMEVEDSIILNKGGIVLRSTMLF